MDKKRKRYLDKKRWSDAGWTWTGGSWSFSLYDIHMDSSDGTLFDLLTRRLTDQKKYLGGGHLRRLLIDLHVFRIFIFGIIVIVAFSLLGLHGGGGG